MVVVFDRLRIVLTRREDEDDGRIESDETGTGRNRRRFFFTTSSSSSCFKNKVDTFRFLLNDSIVRLHRFFY